MAMRHQELKVANTMPLRIFLSQNRERQQNIVCAEKKIFRSADSR
jgi:hypothetical protein